MKKFLTVLLVIAVMFTFSFGSAFAAPSDLEQRVTADDARNQLKAEYQEALKAMDNAMAAELEKYFPGTVTTGTFTNLSSGAIEVSEAVVKAVMTSEVYDAAKKAMDIKYDGYVRAIEQAIAADGFIAFSKEAGGGAAYPQFLIASYDASTYTVASGTDFQILDVAQTTTTNLVAVKAFDAVKQAALDAVNGVVVANYSDKVKPGTTDTYREIAQKIVNQAVIDITNVTIPTKDVAGAVTAIASVSNLYTAPVGKADPTGDVFEGTNGYATLFGLNNLVKVSDEATQTADLAYAKTETLDVVLSALASDKREEVKALQDAIRTEQSKEKVDAKKVSALNDEITDLNAAYDAAVEVITYLINNAETVEELGTINKTTNIFTTGWFYTADNTARTTATDICENFVKGTIDTCAGVIKVGATPSAATQTDLAELQRRAKLVVTAKEQAEKDKVYVSLDGSVAIEIEKALADAIDDIYRTGVNTYAAPTNTTVLQERINELLDTTAAKVKVNGKDYDDVAAWKSNAGSQSTLNNDTFSTVNTVTSSYDKAQFDEIRAIADETKAAIKAATTVADADAAFLAGYAKFDAIPTAAEHAAMFTTAAGALKADYDKYKTALEKLATGIETVELVDADSDYDWIQDGELKTDFVKSVTDDMKAKCFTTAELEAAYNEAVATLNTLKTDKQLASEKSALEAQILALPKAPTVADKAAVQAARAAFDAFNDYVELVGAADATEYKVTNTAAETVLMNAETTIFNAEVKALQEAAKPLVDKLLANKLTLADKAAVETLRADIDAFVAAYADKDESNRRLDALEAKANVSGKSINDLEKEILDLDVDALVDMIAKLSVDSVDAAAVKAARAAFEALSPADQLTFKTLNRTSYDKLVALEKILAVDVQALKITASSTAKKGSITVKWTAKGNTFAADGYQIWKSTKKNSGFKKAFTTTKTTYKNTKGLKKGTRYYFKVRAYKVVDGKNVYSDWSNKAIRIAK